MKAKGYELCRADSDIMSEVRTPLLRRGNADRDSRPCCGPVTIFSTIGIVSIVVIGMQQRPQPPIIYTNAAFDGDDPHAESIKAMRRAGVFTAAVLPPVPKPTPVCGDGKCELPETMATCMADCPGVTSPPQCGEEPHSDPGGYAVKWGAGHLKATATECCDACAAHAADPKNQKRPCNSWVYCHARPYCWSLDTGNFHAFGECWLKFQADPKHPLCACAGGRLHTRDPACALRARVFGQLLWLTSEWVVRASCACRRAARQVHRGVPQEARERAQDGPHARRLASQPVSADTRALDGRRDGHGGRPERQVGDGPRRHALIQGRVGGAVARVGEPGGEPRARRQAGVHAARRVDGRAPAITFQTVSLGHSVCACAVHGRGADCALSALKRPRWVVAKSETLYFCLMDWVPLYNMI